MPAQPTRVLTTIEHLLAAASLFPDREAYVEPATDARERRTVTFGQLAASTPQLSEAFARRGLRAGDVLALVLQSSIDYARCYLAAQWLGAVTTGINPRLGSKQTAELLERCAPALTIVEDDLEQQFGGNVLQRSVLDTLPTSSTRPAYLAEPDEPVAIVWTSGTTARPKGALFSHRSLDAVVAGVDVLGAAGDIRLSPLPFSHVGYMTRVASEMALGISTVITPTPWSAASAISVLASERVTVAQGVPTQWALMLDHPSLNAADLSSLRVAGTGAAKMPASRVEAMRNALKVPVIVRYTSTESSLGCGTLPGDPDDVVAMTVGRPVAGVELDLCDDLGHSVDRGEVGNVRLRTNAAMLGYVSRVVRGPESSAIEMDEELTRSAKSDDGWISTSDLGRLDELRNLELVGRRHELFQRGGYNIYPAEVEEALRTLSAVKDACVVGAPDEILGEVGVAFVIPTDPTLPPTIAEIRQELSPLIADYKRPDVVVVVDQIPVTAMLKVDRNALKPAAEEAAQTRRRPV